MPSPQQAHVGCHGCCKQCLVLCALRAACRAGALLSLPVHHSSAGAELPNHALQLKDQGSRCGAAVLLCKVFGERFKLNGFKAFISVWSKGVLFNRVGRRCSAHSGAL